MSPEIDETANAGIAVIMTEIGHIKTTLDEIKTSLKDVPERYVTRTEYADTKLGYDREIREIKDKHEKDHSTLQRAVEKVEESIAVERRARQVPLPMTITTVVSLGGFVILLIEKIAT